MKRIPLGVDNFAELVNKEKNYLFVDKSLMIKEFIDRGTKVSLIVRPRRWGKTLNMSMMQHFFASTVDGKLTQGLFNDLKIAQVDNGKYLKYQGQNPVIFISFKNIKADQFKSFLKKVKILIQDVCDQHIVLETSNNLTKEDKKKFKKLLNKTADIEELSNALKILSNLLSKHYGKQVIILIDEYDTPLNATFNGPHFEKIAHFFKDIFGSALKGNNALEASIMTGILRLSKNKMLSDINNLILYSFMQPQYGNYFGFDIDEVQDLFTESSVSVDITELQNWYNGYHSGNVTTIYNPWSILNCISNEGTLKPYWIKTGDEDLLKEVLLGSNSKVKEQLKQLLLGASIEAMIDEYISFDQIKQVNNEDILWSLLWTLGYLKIVDEPLLSGARYRCQLRIPNYEVESSFSDVFQTFVRSLDLGYKYDVFLKNLIAGNVKEFSKDLADYLLTVPSWFDLTKEESYQNIMIGLIASLKETHNIYSNREIGLGRPDILLIPKSANNDLGIILEIKKVSPGQEMTYYEKVADAGLNQIKIKQYDATLVSANYIKKILKLCLVFYGKQFVYKYEFALSK